MSYFAKVICLANKSSAAKMVRHLSFQKVKTALISIGQPCQIDRVADYFVPRHEAVGTLEKSYLKEGIKSQAAVLAVQKKGLDKIVRDADEDDIFFVEENFTPESFYLKKELFKRGKKFFTFGKLSFDNSLFVVEGALDIGFHEASFFSKHFLKTSGTKNPFPLSFPQFNGFLAIDSPPDSIPSKYLHYFRLPLQITKNIIKLFNAFSPMQRHHPIFLFNQPQEVQFFSSREVELAKLLGKRALFIDNFHELPYETTVLTWSTHHFFTYLKAGLRPIATSRSLAAFAFNQRKSSLKDLILNGPDKMKMAEIIRFLELSKLQNFVLRQ